jgi:ubiquinone/menaquinone biosynthesis C-methylase UbiE
VKGKKSDRSLEAKMKNESLHKKYANGRHWDYHTNSYAVRFSSFLKAQNFRGLIIDAGCGSGRDTQVFKKAGFNSLGVDHEVEELGRASSKHRHCTFRVMNVEQMPLAGRSVGAVFMINVIHYVDAEKALKEVRRVLEPGGYLFIHFNLKITDGQGKVDLRTTDEEIRRLTAEFKEIDRRAFPRVDKIPTEHKHEILELILQKPDDEED